MSANETESGGEQGTEDAGKLLSEIWPGTKIIDIPTVTVRTLVGMSTFDDFAVDDSNREAFEAMRDVVERPGSCANPLFVYGPGGTGKTHLLWALCNAIRKEHPERRSDFIEGSVLFEDFVNIARTGRPRFIIGGPYLPNSVFVVDDISLVLSRFRADDWLADFIELALRLGIQVVFTSEVGLSDLHPSNRLLRLFGVGAVIGIGESDLALRVSVFKKMLARERGTRFPDFPEEMIEWMVAVSRADGHVLEKNAWRIVEAAETFAGAGIFPDLTGNIDDSELGWECDIQIRQDMGTRLRMHFPGNDVALLLCGTDAEVADSIEPTCSVVRARGYWRCEHCDTKLDSPVSYCPTCGYRLDPLAEHLDESERSKIARALRGHEPGTWERLLGMSNEELAGLVDPRCTPQPWRSDGGRASGNRCSACGAELGSTPLPNGYCTVCGSRIAPRHI